jgi:hypothetical protein
LQTEEDLSHRVRPPGLSQISGVDGSSGMAANFPPVRGDLIILSAIAERLKRRSKDDLSGRGAGYPAPPPQIPACGFVG